MGFVKRITAGLFLALLLAVGAFTAPVSAHVLESDNGVSAILHIKPDDHPIAGKPVPVNFLFSNDVGGFSLNSYAITLSLVKNEVVRFRTPLKPLFFGSATEGEMMATFPTSGAYEVRVEGKPIEPGVPAFRIEYLVTVAIAGGVKKGDGVTTVLLSSLSLIVLGMVAVKVIQNGGKYRRSTKTRSKK